MAGKVAGLVDAGFLRSSISRALGLEVAPFDIDPISLRAWFLPSSGRMKSNLLRIYWYDAIWAPTHQRYREQVEGFDAIDSVPSLRVRLGQLRSKPEPWKNKLFKELREMKVDIDELKGRFDFSDVPEQKGVDTLLVLDMVRLAQQGSCESFILLAGDGDFAEAVREVQELGKEVILAYPFHAGIAPELSKTVDERVELGDVQLRQLLKSKPGLRSFSSEADNS